MEEQELILKIGDLLKTYGVRSVTMDDIARHLKISKKTLYKSFKDKSEIVKKVIDVQCNIEQQCIKDYTDQSENAIDEIMLISNYVNQQLNNMHPSVHFDLERFYPESYAQFCTHKDTYVKQVIEDNLKRGVEEGLYRSNLDPEVIAILYVQKLDSVWDPSVFPSGRYTFTQVYAELIRYHIRGVASPAGIKYLEKRIQKDQPNF